MCTELEFIIKARGGMAYRIRCSNDASNPDSFDDFDFYDFSQMKYGMQC